MKTLDLSSLECPRIEERDENAKGLGLEVPGLRAEKHAIFIEISFALGCSGDV
jgi:hypothetical protein